MTLGAGWGALLADGVAFGGDRQETVRRAAGLAEARAGDEALRWVWWSADEVAPALLAAGVRVDRSWDVAEVHRLLSGEWRADPAAAWAFVHGLDPTASPRPTGNDLFDFADRDPPRPRAGAEAAAGARARSGGPPAPRPSGADPAAVVPPVRAPARGDATASGIGPTAAPVAGMGPANAPRTAIGSADAPGPENGSPDSPVRADGYLRPDAVSGDWQDRPARALAWAQALATVATRQLELRATPRHRHTAWSESAAAVLCLELERDGLPIDRARAERLLAHLIGPRPRDDADALRLRAARDDAVLRHVPGRDRTDLRSPDQVRALLAAVGIDVPDTRKHRLAPYRGTHPVVEALLTWRAAERVATTYGYRWLDTHVGPDGRLRGRWTACDGAAGRMTAQNGLHNLPAVLRAAVAAEPGRVLVRADLGQIEPRVLAAVSGDPALMAATHAPDLYAPVAAELGLDRPTAKVAVLAAMYGQTSGAAGAALRRLSLAYPRAIGYLDDAYARGVAGAHIETYGGRRVGGTDGHALPAGVLHGGDPPGGSAPHRATGPTGPMDQAARARGRFLRNAAVQGAAAELFKAWAATVRVAVRPLDAQIVLCLHDELVVHSPVEHATLVAEAVDAALTSAAARWAGGAPVRFVADTSIVQTWADAKAVAPAERKGDPRDEG